MTTATKPKSAAIAEPAEEVENREHENGSLVIRTDEPMVMDIRRALPQAVAQFEAIQEFVKSTLKESVEADSAKGVEARDGDYGRVPGVAKPFLFKSGAEKIATLFGYSPVYVTLEKIEDWGERQPNGFFFYRYRCDLQNKNSGNVMGAGIGSCNSKENRYRWRTKNAQCPACDVEAIRVSTKGEESGTFYCWRKLGGCGQKFAADDPAIISQKSGRIENDDLFSQVNTIDKMAQKRALVAAVLIATGTSSLFTQDEDTVEAAPTAKATTVTVETPASNGTAAPKAATPATNGNVEWVEVPEFIVSHDAAGEVRKPNPLFGKMRGKKNTELAPLGFKWGRPVKDAEGNDKFPLLQKLPAGVTKGMPPEPPRAAPVVAGPFDVDKEIRAVLMQKDTLSSARVMKAAHELGAEDGDWKKVPQEKKGQFLDWLTAQV